MGCCTTIPAESQQQPVPNTKSTSQIPKYDLNEDHTVVQPLKSNEINTNDRSTPTKTDRVEELSAMRISKLKRILQKQIQLNESRLSDDEIKKYNFQKFIEKYEFVNAICTLENLNHCTSDNKEYDDYMRTNVIKDTMIKPQVSTVKLSPKDVRTNELKSKKVAQLKYLLRQYTTNLNDTNFIEKSEYVNAIIEFEFNGSIRTDSNNITELTYVNKKQNIHKLTRNCAGNVAICWFVDYFVHIMEKYNRNVDDIDISQLVDSYHHILEKHNDDISCKNIRKHLTDCEAQCHILAEIYGGAGLKYQLDAVTKSKQRILDIIHCFCYHGFDGELLNGRHRFSRFNQNQCVEETKTEQSNMVIIDNTFQLGLLFEYGYHGENNDTRDCVTVNPIYSNFKEELIQNKIAQLTVEQYDLEYKKVSVHWNSVFRKKYYSKPFQPSQNIHVKLATVSFHKEHLLSLMIYCNYDQLQGLFSKTYREKNGNDHKYFYYLGMNLKIAVKMFGTTINDNSIKKYYHGMQEKLNIRYTFSMSPGIPVHCPLSTTSSFAVAASFTGDSNGMVIEFTGMKIGIKSMDGMQWCRSFSCAWLSDYPNEKEYLFIQQTWNPGDHLYINDVHLMSNLFTYGHVMDALLVIHYSLDSSVTMMAQAMFMTQEIKELAVGILKDRLPKTSKLYLKFKSLNPYARDIISNYFESQRDITIHPLSWQHNKLQRTAEMAHYLRVTTSPTYHCKKQITTNSVNDTSSEGKLSFLSDIFVESKSQCVQLDHVVSIFPNIVFVDVKDVVLSRDFMDSLFRYLNDKSIRETVDILRIVPIECEWTAAKVVSQCKSRFNAIGYNLIEIKDEPHSCKSEMHMCSANSNNPELEIVKHSRKFSISRTCTGKSCLKRIS